MKKTGIGICLIIKSLMQSNAYFTVKIFDGGLYFVYRMNNFCGIGILLLDPLNNSIRHFF